MTVQELMNELENVDPDAEVRIAQQPQWPFEYDITSVTEVKPEELYEVCLGDDGWQVEDGDDILQDGFSCDADAQTWLKDYIGREHGGKCDGVVYIAEGRQIGYLPSIASRAVGWR